MTKKSDFSKAEKKPYPEGTPSSDESRKEYGALFDAVSKILYRLDPIGINYGDNKDEYDPEASTILPRLKDCKTQRQTRNVIHEEFIAWFGDSAGPKEVYNEAAKEILEAWLKK